jgi:hypothetical protein
MGPCKLFLPRLAWNKNPPDLTLQSSQNYRNEPLAPCNIYFLADKITYVCDMQHDVLKHNFNNSCTVVV